MTKIFKQSILVVTAMLFAGCATTSPRDAEARTLAMQTFGTNAYLKVLWFPTSYTESFTMTFLGDSGPQLQIADAMEAAKDKREDLVFWCEGPKPSEATFAIKQALKYYVRNRLEQLNFLFVGDATEAENIRPLIESTGAKFYFHQN